MRKGVGERRRGAGEWINVPPVKDSAPGKISTWSVGHQSFVNSAQLFMLFVPMGGCPRHVVHAH